MDEVTPHFQVTFMAPLWVWSGDAPASWHFVTLPMDVAEALRGASYGQSGRFGMVHVTAHIGDVVWETKLFKDTRTGSYLLPVKAAVRKKAGVKMGDMVEVSLEYDV